jgi:hypothetical protein
MELSRLGQEALMKGRIKIRVMRSGMIQQITFTVTKVKVGNIEYTELFSDRQIDTSELLRVANETGLPVEARNGKAFPEGKGASDFESI